MKKEISPAIAIIAVVLILALAGGAWLFFGKGEEAKRPTDAQAAGGKMVGGKRLPVAAGGGGDSATTGDTSATKNE